MLQNKAFGTFIAAMLLFPSDAVGQSSRKGVDTQKGSKAKVIKLICVKSGDLYGYIDLKGVFVINPQFQPAHPFDKTSGLSRQQGCSSTAKSPCRLISTSRRFSRTTAP